MVMKKMGKLIEYHILLFKLLMVLLLLERDILIILGSIIMGVLIRKCMIRLEKLDTHKYKH
jgi:hypothetical protein